MGVGALFTPDYHGAVCVPTDHHGGPIVPKWFIFHGTGFDASQSAVGVMQDFQTSNPDSAHYSVGRDGQVAQGVPEHLEAWCNGPITGTPGVGGPAAGQHDPWWSGDGNRETISCETVNARGNSLPLTPAQQAAAFALCADVCRRRGIPMRPADANGGITGHFSLDPIERAYCPGSLFPWAALWDYLKGAATVAWTPWMAPGAEAISEFARDHLGGYRHARCVETAALEDAIALHPAMRAGIGNMGDYLNEMVGQWMAYGTGVTFEGASSYVDATRWLRGLGFTVDEDVMSGGWWAELQHGLEIEHCVYLVGVTNAQGLHGDESGVQNHGLAALGIDGAGNIVCGDPDNQAAQVNMPGNPVGAFVTYTEQDFINGQISSLTKVHPMSLTIDQVSAYFTATDDQHWVCKQTGKPVQMGLLAAYRAWPSTGTLAGLTALGLPTSGERYPKVGVAVQDFERGTLVWDPGRLYDSPPGATGPVYLAHVATPGAPGTPPAPAPAPVDTSAAKAAASHLAADLATLDTALAAL